MLFSISCLTYKRPELLEEAVYSVLQQTCKDWELLIINDCVSQTIQFDHPQIRIFNLKNKFLTIADKRNFGVANATGQYVLQLDDDDFLLPFYLDNLKKAIGNADWLSAQRPILYFDERNILLSPVPQVNTFIYKRETVGKQFHYESTESDEGITLNPFYLRVKWNFKGKKVIMQLKTEQYGHVWRQGDDSKRKYSLANFIGKDISLEDQKKTLELIENREGEIILQPKWSKDYTTLIRDNMRKVNLQTAYSQIKGAGEEAARMKEIAEIVKKFQVEIALTSISGSVEKPSDSWQKVKPTWANAIKFLEAAKSRGIVSTVLDATGINKTLGERVSDDILQQRKHSCFGDKKTGIEPCHRLQYVEKRGYFCGSCGCGKNDLARLDADSLDEYTKLHYPELQCPLKRRGFSNADMHEYVKIPYKTPLSIIIPVLNDNEELNLTIQSIRDTSPPEVEIIVIDDKSDVPAMVDDKFVKLTRLETRQGVGATRHLGATLATADYLLFVDSHMRFHSDWYNNIMSKLMSSPSNVVWCATCLGLDKDNMDITNPRGSYNGAKLVLYEPNENQVFEGKWIEDKEGDEYEISCLMGACYFFHRSWFHYIGGTKSLKMWGSDEPLLSIKTLLAGGSIRLIKSVKIGHKFRDAASYSTGVYYLLYNKLRSIKMVLSNETYERLKDKIPNTGDKEKALAMIVMDEKEIKEESSYYKRIFTRDEKWLCETHKICVP